METTLWKKLPKTNAIIAKVLYDYYWLHRNHRVSMLHRYCGLKAKEFDELGKGLKKADMADMLKVMDALQVTLTDFTAKITAYKKELLDGIRREHGES